MSFFSASWSPYHTYTCLILVFIIAVRRIIFVQLGRGTDEWFHLLLIRQIRERSHTIPRVVDGFALKSPFNYPWLLHYILSFVPERFVGHFGRALGVLSHIFLCALVIYVGYAAAAVYLSTDVALPVAVMAGALIATAPSAYNRLSAAHATISERPLAVLLVFGYIAAAGWGYSFEAWGAFGLAIVMGALVFLVSKFGVQAIFFSSVILSAISLNPLFIVCLIISLLLAIIISFGRAFEILRGSIEHSISFYSVLQWRSIISLRNNRGLLEILRQGLQTKLDRSTIMALWWSPIFRGVAFNLIIVYFVPVSIISDWSLYPFIEYLTWAGLAGLLVWFVVATVRPLRFLGEADRYIYFVSQPPMAIVCVVYAWTTTHPWATGLLFLIIVANITVIIADIISRSNSQSKAKSSENNQSEIWSILERLNPRRILPIPITLGSEIVYRTGIPVISFAGNVTPAIRSLYTDLFPRCYPYPTPDFEWLKRDFNMDAIVIAKRSMDTAKKMEVGVDYSYNFTPWHKAFEDDEFLVYTLPGW